MNKIMLALGAILLVQPATAAPKWDTNADGKMTKDEFVKMASTRMIERADTSKDGKVSLEEWNKRPMAIKAKAAGKDPAKRFTRLDANKDGFVEPADFGARLEKRFDRMDTDKDGVLTKEERRAAREMARDRMPKRG